MKSPLQNNSYMCLLSIKIDVTTRAGRAALVILGENEYGYISCLIIYRFVTFSVLEVYIRMCHQVAMPLFCFDLF